ncbi:hypothetical protein BKA56DRAFT_680828 [Ilyonectria sp. MPI-CAGE-AT-0026]|nr:hypothetical protein BKA56DRAFT_680828 [Ilyonectria sp. MPI-CAGE-AT-0026]
MGGLGICVSGEYAPFAAQSDLRIKAYATAAAVCVGTMDRRGLYQDLSDPTSYMLSSEMPPRTELTMGQGGNTVV